MKNKVTWVVSVAPSSGYDADYIRGQGEYPLEAYEDLINKLWGYKERSEEAASNYQNLICDVETSFRDES